ncbi:inorganic diphosphatase [Adhaeribacter pallidiroseus]|uniref:inorganic diphosphatase n=1 Tax=Adhaeribacter pallidiroseus TaxID=2072847 RepID=A0A369QMU1_9BACT|nr:inorganic diphosphatase [Adhaeribacter pallidiroseus]RDC64536.1 Inorganic diphosphatase [Adhaeribacter pallidiroseus]
MARSCLLYGLIISIHVCLAGCKTNYDRLPAFTDRKYLQAIVEIPAGTNQVIKYNAKKQEFENVTEQAIRYLPYPGNFGFIPSTRTPGEQAGDEQPIDIFVLAESQPSGTVLEVVPIGILFLERDGLPDPKIIAVPAKPTQQIIVAEDYATFLRKYPEIKEIITEWFRHANPSQKVRIIGWKNEKFAEDYIRRHLL